MKQRITVTIDSDSYQLLKSADVNISVNRAMQNEARRLRSERWQAENQEGMAEVARFIEMNGSFADENRDW
ncbi:type II toxin-antitoxin system antitoxin CcdA [Klebsiella pneumoniae]|nr:type II toxin-antitoxin system antitoxin CcdA [Klebsiella pneumoniae]